MVKTPQVKPDWNTGIYIGDGVVAKPKEKQMDKRHGGPFDRGGADYYYGRGKNPHFYVGDTYSSERIEMVDMDLEEIEEYRAGYAEAERNGDRKEW